MKIINVAYEHVMLYNSEREEDGNVVFGSSFFWEEDEYRKGLFLNGLKKINEIEEQYGLKFPINFSKFNSLEEEAKHQIRRPIYGINTETICYKYYDYKVAIKLNLKFIVPIRIDTFVVDTLNLGSLRLPQELLNYLTTGRARIIFYQDHEGYLCNFKQIEWFNAFARKFNLNPSNMFVESANLKWTKVVDAFRLTKNTHIVSDPVLFTPKFSSNFFGRIWFSNRGISNILDKPYHYNQFYNFLYNRVMKRHKKKILCLQRRQSDVRSVIFHKLHTDPKLSNCSLYSLLNPYNSNIDNITLGIERLKLDNSNEIAQWFRNNFDVKKGFPLDKEDHYVNWATDLNPDLYYDAFINLTVETHQFPSSELFFSEKTLKPIYAAQPFILFGNPESLKYLKKLGYKTFSNFWDESYDEDVPFKERLNRLFKLLDHIAEKPMNELNGMLEDLQPILEHNFNVLMSANTVFKKNLKLYEWCKDDTHKNLPSNPSNLI